MWSRLRGIAVLAAVVAGLALSATAAQAATSSGDLPAPTQTNPVSGVATSAPWGPAPPVLVGVRTGRHDHYDRTVFDFTGGTPDYQVGYGVLVAEGSGATIPVAGSATLVVRLSGAYTRNPSTGAGTFDLHQVINPALPTLRQIKFGGEFEAHIGAGLGLADRVGFRVFTLTGPPRLVVDVAHQPTQPFGSAAVSRTGPAPEVVVERVRSGRHPGYDRVVFDLRDAGLPTLRAGYVGAGSTIDVGFIGRGSATLSPHATFAGRSTVAVGLPELRAVSFTVRGAGLMNARITTAGRHGFRVMVLTSPTRVVLDVAY